MNVPMTMGILVSSKMATLHELQTVYGMKDAYDMMEILYIDNQNQQIANRKARNGNGY